MTPAETEALPEGRPNKQDLIKRYLQSQAAAGKGASRIRPRDAATVPPPSWGQQQILLHSELAPGVPLYNESVTIRRYGPLNVIALEYALNEFVLRHEIMRTSFRFVDGQPVQFVYPAIDMRLPVEDLERLAGEQREAEAVRLAVTDSRRVFDVTAAPLFRVRLVRFHANEHRLLFTLHHSIFDGAAVNEVLLPELVALYEAFDSEKPSPPPPELQYADFACWQRENVTTKRLAGQLEYWREKLGGELPTLELPTDHARPLTSTFQGAAVPFRIPLAVAESLTALAKENGATPYILLLAGFYVLLHRYASQNDIVIGSIQSVRNRSELERVMGYFLNTLPLRVDLTGNPSFLDLVAKVRGATLEAFSNAEIPFAELVQRFDSRRNPGRNPFFDVFFSLNPSFGGGIPGWDITHLDADAGVAKFDLHMEMDGRPDGFHGRLLFKTDLFERASIERMTLNWETLLTGIAAAPNSRIDDLPIMPEDARRKVLVEWNDTQRGYPECAVHELVEAQVERSPHAEAIVFEADRLTYFEFNQRANRLARWLVKQGAGPDVLIGICMERCVEMAISLLAVLKAGAAYVPLDPENPAERLSRIVEDSNPRVILTQSKFSGLPAFEKRRALAVDRAASSLERESDRNLGAPVRPDDLAYVIYTSGSTGQPKGVMVPHRGICNRIHWMQEAWPLSSSDRVLQKTSYCFDVSVPEFFGTWMAGAALVILQPGGHRDAGYIARTIIDEEITQVHFVPSQLQFFLDEPEAESCDSLRRVLCSGEALTVELERRFHARLSATLLNMYGPTEAAVEVSAIQRTRHETGRMTIGRPITNTKLYVLDPNMQPMPIGAVGELYIGGVQVARGYLNNPELTAERFLPDPFDTTPGSRIYRTGDRARFLEDGQIEFLGRLDGQVKIRGFRVELGEIEEAIRRFPGEHACAVAAETTASGQQCLMAYIGSTAGLRTEDLDRHLRGILPDYMVPQRYVVLDRLPLGSTGKLDRRALQASGALAPAVSEPAEPRNEIECELVRIWRDVLQVDSIGVNEDFFALGGNSLLVSRLIRQIEGTFGHKFSMASMFVAPTIAKFGKLLQSPDTLQPPARIIPVQPNGSRPPLFLCMDGGPMYRGLAGYLGSDQPLLGVALDNSDFDGLEATNLEEVAKLLAKSIREAQPQGPYHLAGWCLSGVIAYETARQLALGGDRVALVALFDAANFGYFRSMSRPAKAAFYARKVAYHLEQLQHWETAPQYMKKRIAGLGEQYSRMKFRLRSRRAEVDAGEVESPAVQATRDYSAKRYEGRVVSFIPKQRPGGKHWDFSTSWRDAAPRLEVCEVPGDHQSMFAEPNVRTLADSLMKNL